MVTNADGTSFQERVHVPIKRAGEIRRIDATNGGVVPSAEGITIIGSTLWYTSYRQRLLAAVDLRTGQERQRYRLPGDPTGMCWDGARLWYCDYMHRQLCAVHLPVLENAAVPWSRTQKQR